MAHLDHRAKAAVLMKKLRVGSGYATVISAVAALGNDSSSGRPPRNRKGTDGFTWSASGYSFRSFFRGLFQSIFGIYRTALGTGDAPEHGPLFPVPLIL